MKKLLVALMLPLLSANILAQTCSTQGNNLAQPSLNSPNGTSYTTAQNITLSFYNNASSATNYRVQVAPTSTNYVSDICAWMCNNGAPIAGGINHAEANVMNGTGNYTYTFPASNLGVGTYYWNVRVGSGSNQSCYSPSYFAFTITAGGGSAPCTNTSAYGTQTAPSSGQVVTQANVYAGEYSTWNSVSSGTTYTVTSSISTDYLTIRAGSPTGSVLTHGVTSQNFTGYNGTVYVHVNTNSSCGTQQSNRNITMGASGGSPTCSAPSTISSSNYGQTTATINWSGGSSIQYFRLTYRQVGTSTWSEINNISASATYQNLSGLSCNTDYEYRLFTYTSCSGTPEFSSLLTFSTTACNIPTSTITVSSPLAGSFIQGSPMAIGWNSSNVAANAPITIQIVNCLNNTVVATVVDGTITNSGSYFWNNVTLSQGDYRIKIYVTNQTTVSNIGSGCFSVDYQSPTCTYSIDPSSATIPAAGSSYTVSVTTQSGCTWTVDNSGVSSWASVSPTSGTGSGSFTVTVAQNTGTNQRSGNIFIEGQTHSITQSGVNCTAPSSPSNPKIAANGIGLSWGAATGSPTLNYEWIVNQSSTNPAATPIYASNSVTQTSTTMTAPGCGTGPFYLHVRTHSNCGNGSYSGWVHSAEYSPAPCCTSPSVSTQPTDQAVTIGQNAIYSIAITGGTMPVYYNWQYSEDGVSNWAGITSSTPILGNSISVNTGYVTSSSTSSSLTIGTANLNLDGYKFRCRVIVSCDLSEVMSNVVELTVCSAINGGNLIPDRTTGSNFKFEIQGLSTSGLSYQWYVKRIVPPNDLCWFECIGESYLDWTLIDNSFSGVSGFTSKQLNFGKPFLNGLDCSSCPNRFRFKCIVTSSCGTFPYENTPDDDVKKKSNKWRFVKSYLANAEVMIFSDGFGQTVWTNERGQIDDYWDFSQSEVDSIIVSYPGCITMTLPVELDSELRFVAMLKDGSTTNLIRYPRVNFWQSTPYYNINLPMLFYVQGENIQGFEVYELDDTLGIIQPPVFVSNLNDSTGAIPPTTTGRHWYGFLLTGVDSAMIYKFVDFHDLSETYPVTVNAPQSLHGADVYFDGQYLRHVLQSPTYTLPPGDHTLTFKRLGYADTTIYVTGTGTHSLTMQPIDHSSLTDSIIHLAVNTTAPRYWKSSTILSNNALFDVSLKQYEHPESPQWSLQPRSRMFRFRNLNGAMGSLRAAIVLDQPEYLTPDSVYLMQIVNGTDVVKHLPTVQSSHSYDSVFQKLLLDVIPFEGESTIDYVFMKRQAPIASGTTLSTNEDESFAISIYDLFADPDSIPNDLTFTVNGTGTGISVQVVGDSIYITTDANYNGSTSIDVEATHDWLTISETIDIEVQAVNDPPEVTFAEPLTFCHGSEVSINLTPQLVDVDNPINVLTIDAEVTGTQYPAQTTDVSIGVSGQVLTFSSTSAAGGVYQVSITANDGMDDSQPEVVTVTILPNAEFALSQTICNGETFEGYATAGLYTDMFTSANGCDSTRVLSLNVLPQATSEFSTGICDGQQFEGYTAAGTYSDVFTAANGCDSTRTLHLEVWENPTSVVQGSICAGESFEGYDEAGSFTDVFQSVNGCDSTRTLELELHELPLVNLGSDTAICNGTSIVLDAGDGFSSYAWNTNYSTQQIMVDDHGYFVVTVTDVNGCSNEDDIIIDLIPYPNVPILTVMPGSVLSSSYPDGNQWYLDGELIEGATGQQITPTSTGVYTVVYTAPTGCSSESGGISVMVGIDDLDGNSPLAIFPNPNSGTFTVRFTGVGNITLRLMDAAGRTVAQRSLVGNSGVTTQEFTGIASGMYLLEGVSETERFIRRVVVK